MSLLDSREQAISNLMVLGASESEEIDVYVLAVAIVGVLMQKSGVPASAVTKMLQILTVQDGPGPSVCIIDGLVMAIVKSPTESLLIRLSDMKVMPDATGLSGVVVTEFNISQTSRLITRLLAPKVT